MEKTRKRERIEERWEECKRRETFASVHCAVCTNLKLKWIYFLRRAISFMQSSAACCQEKTGAFTVCWYIILSKNYEENFPNHDFSYFSSRDFHGTECTAKDIVQHQQKNRVNVHFVDFVESRMDCSHRCEYLDQWF